MTPTESLRYLREQRHNALCDLTAKPGYDTALNLQRMDKLVQEEWDQYRPRLISATEISPAPAENVVALISARH